MTRVTVFDYYPSPNQASLHNALSLIELFSVLQSRPFLALMSSTRSLIMPTLVQRNAQESVETTAEPT
jgi:hypothetical protein